MKRLAPKKQVQVLAALTEGMPINAVCRVLKTGKHAVLRVIAETGAALADYSDKKFRNLVVERLAMDEQWQYVGKHGQRMHKKEADRGDFWLWAGIDSDTKLIVSHHIGRRDLDAGEHFIEDIASRITGYVQIATDPHKSYVRHIQTHFGPTRISFAYATESKIFIDPFLPEKFPTKRKNGIPKIIKAERETVFGYPDLRTSTTCHIERFFLTVRQELKRFQRLGLGYSKDLAMHCKATAMQIGIYNLCRKHASLGRKTPAQAAGVEDKAWTLEDVVALTAAYHAPRKAIVAAIKAKAKREREDAVFLAALAQAEL